MTKFIFIIGGVISGFGKGITTSSIGQLLKSRGFTVTAMKGDPYVNVDAGTMNPTEHGEVFVTEDGMETDQDIGNYERFLNQDILSINYMTTGSIYKSVIDKERNLEYNGQCVSVIPEIPNEIIHRIKIVAEKTKADFLLFEIGGTAGEYQNLIFLEAARMLHLENSNQVMYVLVSYIPQPSMVGEMKTKPTQYAVRTLNSAGIQPDIIIARASSSIDDVRKRKIATFCNIKPENIISAPDEDSIYKVPINFERDGLIDLILKKFSLEPENKNGLLWKKFVNTIDNAKKKIKIGIVGKYFETGDFILSDSYISVIEAIKHASWASGVKPKIHWLNSLDYEKDENKLSELKEMDGIIVPGGFGKRGINGKIKTIKYVRENKIPFLGLCYGMQLATIEFARNVALIEKANSREIEPETTEPVIDIMNEQKTNLDSKKYGGTMRLGTYDCEIAPYTIAYIAYGKRYIS
ncbi:MAG: CTP synthase [Patescibacteria group bacterium]